MRADGRDVAFFDQRGATPVRLSHERQLFRNGVGTDDEALFWVKVPSFNPSTEPGITMGAASTADDLRKERRETDEPDVFMTF